MYNNSCKWTHLKIVSQEFSGPFEVDMFNHQFRRILNIWKFYSPTSSFTIFGILKAFLLLRSKQITPFFRFFHQTIYRVIKNDCWDFNLLLYKKYLMDIYVWHHKMFRNVKALCDVGPIPQTYGVNVLPYLV